MIDTVPSNTDTNPGLAGGLIGLLGLPLQQCVGHGFTAQQGP
jgi:hypothetical protein